MSRLSVMFFSDKPSQQPNLPSTVNTDLIAFISDKALSAGFANIKELAKAFDTKNNDKIIRNLQEFGVTSRLNQFYMDKLIKLLAIDKSEIDAINNQHWDNLKVEENLFIKHFDLLFKNQDLIAKHEEYRNITFFGLGISSAWVGRRRPLALGELYYHWQNKQLLAPDCCGQAYIFSASGSALSGCHQFLAICGECKKVVSGQRPTFGEILKPYLTYEAFYDYVPTDYTVKQLVDDLLKLEGK